MHRDEQLDDAGEGLQVGALRKDHWLSAKRGGINRERRQGRGHSSLSGGRRDREVLWAAQTC